MSWRVDGVVGAAEAASSSTYHLVQWFDQCLQGFPPDSVYVCMIHYFCYQLTQVYLITGDCLGVLLNFYVLCAHFIAT